MTSLAKTERAQAVAADTLLSRCWSYTDSVVLESIPLSQQKQHRVLTRWQSEQGEELCFIMNFIAADKSSAKVVIPSSQCRPQIDRRVRVLDRFGFEIQSASRRALEWDLLMHLDLDAVSDDLQKRLQTH